MKKLITAILLLAVMSVSADYYNITNQRKYAILPQSYAGVSHYPMATHRHKADGFYPLVEFTTPDGYQKVVGTQTYTLDGDVVRENWQVQTDAEKAQADQQAFPDKYACQASLAALLADFGITLPIQPATAMTQMFAYWQAHPEDTTLTAKAQQVQFLYTRLRMEYGMTDPQIGGLE